VCCAVLVDGLSADAELASQGRLRDTLGCSVAQLRYLFGSEESFAAAVGTALFGQGNTVALTLFDQSPFNSRTRP
jgi:hypothetical protein